MLKKSSIRKAVFPVAGLGTRFLPATKASPKEMLPIVDKPLIQSAVEEAVAAGVLLNIESFREVELLAGISKELGLPALIERLRTTPEIEELIIATNPSVEGEATAHYLREATRSLPLMVTRLAQGVPVGGELEYLGGSTLTHALSGRRPV